MRGAEAEAVIFIHLQLRPLPFQIGLRSVQDVDDQEGPAGLAALRGDFPADEEVSSVELSGSGDHVHHFEGPAIHRDRSPVRGLIRPDMIERMEGGLLRHHK